MLSVVLYVGLLTALVGGLSLLRPFGLLGIRSRRAGAAVLALGLVAAAVACAWPVRAVRTAKRGSHIDAVMPVCEFHEVHSIRVRASPHLIFSAIHAVTPGEIRFFHTLMAIRALPERLLRRRPQALVPGYTIASFSRRDTTLASMTGRGGERRATTGAATFIEYRVKPRVVPASPETILARYIEAVRRRGGERVATRGCCGVILELGNPGMATWVEVTAQNDGRSFRLVSIEPSQRLLAGTPLLDLFLGSGFIKLVEEPDRELVLGGVQRYWQRGAAPPPRIGGAAEFAAFDTPDFVKVAFDLRVEEEGGGWTRITTETRVLATDPSARRKFAVYWRFIYPGSAIIRHSMLAAIRRRAERESP
jgi:hypothetical protein